MQFFRKTKKFLDNFIICVHVFVKLLFVCALIIISYFTLIVLVIFMLLCQVRLNVKLLYIPSIIQDSKIILLNFLFFLIKTILYFLVKKTSILPVLNIYCISFMVLSILEFVNTYIYECVCTCVYIERK